MDHPDKKIEDKSRVRSPAYPSIDLEDAIDKARLLYDAEDQRFANVEAIAAHWETATKNSGFQLALAALKQFGLLVDEGAKEHRRAKLTELAVDILEHPEGSQKRDDSIRAAALTPKIHRELWEKYGGNLPPDVSIRLYLVRERENVKFNKNQVDAFIAQFRSTIAFAKLSQSDTITLDDDAAEDANHRVVGRSPAQFSRFLEERRLKSEQPNPPLVKPTGRSTMPTGTKEATLPLDTGMLYLAWPENIRREEIEDVENWMQMMIRKMKRSAEAVEPMRHAHHKSQAGDTESRSDL